MTAVTNDVAAFSMPEKINRRFELENIYITAHDGQVG